MIVEVVSVVTDFMAIPTCYAYSDEVPFFAVQLCTVFTQYEVVNRSLHLHIHLWAMQVLLSSLGTFKPGNEVTFMFAHSQLSYVHTHLTWHQ